MRFLADVNIPQSVIVRLRKANHDVLDSKKAYLSASDTSLIRVAEEEERIIVTRDKDFIGLVQFPKYQVLAIIIRLKNQTPLHIAERIMELLAHQEERLLKESLTIVTEASADSYPYAMSE